MTGDDIHAFRPPRTPTEPRRRARWPWVLGTLILLLALWAACSMAALMLWADGPREGLSISINGQRWEALPNPTELGVLAAMGLGGSLLAGLALLAVVVVVPCVVLLAMAVALLGTGLGLGAALMAVLLMLGLAAAPLWLPLLLLWLLLRRALRPPRRPDAA